MKYARSAMKPNREKLNNALKSILSAPKDNAQIEQLCYRPGFGERNFVNRLPVSVKGGVQGCRWFGREEKADDVPARLSVNEFVFTADAVRNAGGGDIDQGAKVMENMMKHLEQGGQVSEESQGMAGARDMFETSERLSEVI